MFSPDREPHPAATEIKFLQQPAVFVPLEAHSDAQTLRVTVQDKKATVRLQVVNRYSFIDLSHIAWSWQLVSNRNVKPVRKESFVLQGDVAHVSLENAISRVIHLEKTKPTGGNSFYLNLRGRLKSATRWADAGHLIVSQQFPIRFFFQDTDILPSHVKPTTKEDSSTLSAETVDTFITISKTSANGRKTSLASFDSNTGAMVSYSPTGKNLLAAPLTVNFTRAATDNDRGKMAESFPVGVHLTL